MTTDGSDEQANVPAEGDVITHERTFTAEDAREFGKITGDQQSIHTDPDEEGRLVVRPGAKYRNMFSPMSSFLAMDSY